jgi:bacillithiol biosynthesis cysteine-adding enzyme BshC
MESHCLRQDRLPGTSRLILDYAYRFHQIPAFYRHAPYAPDSLERATAEIRYPAERRAALANALEMQNPGSPLLEVLRRADSVVVATGQQVGYLGGPAYTVFKALTAIRVAESLAAKGISAVPVFWLASEDHDLEEVDHAWLFDGHRQPSRYQAETHGVSAAPVGWRTAPPVRRGDLEAVFAHLPFGHEVVALAAEAYREGQTYTQAFRELVERILGRHRVLFLDPLQPEIRALAAPLLAQAVEQFPALFSAVEQRSRALEAAGYHRQVHLDADSSFFFLLEEGQRLSLKARQGAFVNAKRSWSEAELAARAAEISPNALLRPVLQDYLLPTVCLVGGPAEIAYLAQSAPIYEQLLGRQPVFLPRNGFTLLDESAARHMDRYGLTLPDFFSPEATFQERLARTQIPAELLEKMEYTVGRASALFDEMRRELLSFDPTLAAASERSQSRVVYQFQKLERKIAREIARREDRIRADAEYLRGLVYPQKHLQERLYSFLPFLAVHGTGLVDVIHGSIHEDCPDHHVLVV